MSNMNWNEEVLNEMLSTPSQAMIEDVAKIQGDIMILGAGGKMGPDMCVLAARAVKAAGIEKKVYAVSRFSDAAVAKRLTDEGVVVISGDLTADGVLEQLPDCENIVFMAGRKFGTDGGEWQTWAMNATLPAFVAEKFKKYTCPAYIAGGWYIF